MKKDLLTLNDITPADWEELYALGREFKLRRSECHCRVLENKSIGLIFAAVAPDCVAVI